MLKFSVIMSIYKSDVPDYVRIALDSILNQTLLPIICRKRRTGDLVRLCA